MSFGLKSKFGLKPITSLPPEIPAEIVSWIIIASAGAGGSIEPLGEIEVIDSGNQGFTITADEGYEIDDVLVDGNSVGSVGSYLFENVIENHTIEVSFILPGFYLLYPCDFVDANFSAYNRYLFDGDEVFVMNGNDPNSSIPFAVFNRNTGALLRQATGESTYGIFDMCIFNGSVWLTNSSRGSIWKYNKDGSFIASYSALCFFGFASLTADNVNNVLFVHCGNYLKSYNSSLSQIHSISIGNSGRSILYLNGKIFVLLDDQILIYNATTLAAEGSFGSGQFGDGTNNFFTDGTYLYINYSDSGTYPTKVFDSGGNLITTLPVLGSGQNWIFGKDSNGYWLRYATDNGSGGCFSLTL